ncbi:uncharacterized protein LOC109504422 [Harpegnathos saltator]|uniref:uncharacterized protein LOC109504422 n=1 Tax=Harpegnathos saltator TaxID=610380 RepID=UPI000948CA92|nr:uncharacterized protein LOC109504422 [Harpegnathos saltator]
MICIETQHFNLNRILLFVTGLWPYRRSSLVRFQFALFLCIMISFIIFQMTTFITTECTIDLLVNVICSILFFIPFLIKYCSFYINIQTLKYLLEKLQHICNGLEDKNEVAIIEKYGYDGKRYTTNIISKTI